MDSLHLICGLKENGLTTYTNVKSFPDFKGYFNQSCLPEFVDFSHLEKQTFLHTSPLTCKNYPHSPRVI